MNADREITKINTIKSIAELKAYWSALNETQPDAVRDKRVVDAKDERKAAILAKQKEAAA